MTLLGEDGVDYINIYSQGQTALGHSLSNWSICNIHTTLGFFKTIEGLIFFLGSFNNKFRTMSGWEAKSFGEKADRGIRLPEDIFKNIIIEAMWLKVDEDEELAEALRESTLPFVHYYNYQGKKVFAPKWDWQLEEWEKIRQELQRE